MQDVHTNSLQYKWEISQFFEKNLMVIIKKEPTKTLNELCYFELNDPIYFSDISCSRTAVHKTVYSS